MRGGRNLAQNVVVEALVHHHKRHSFEAHSVVSIKQRITAAWVLTSQRGD
jgi:hypothetical protein